jgi:RNase H-fold protein (predicted Holliday junction resolvase)
MLKQEYFSAHQDLIEEASPNIIIIESYKLFGHKAKQQSGSNLETPQLIGFIEMVAFRLNIKVVFQDPSQKVRVADDILTRMGVFEKKGNKYYCQGKQTNLHMRDAIRHGIFYIRYKLKEEVK